MPDLTDPSAHNWRQGTVVPRDLPGVAEHCEFRVIQPVRENDLLVIATQDCDLCSPAIEEPEVEFVVARPGPEDNNLRHGKSARRLQIDLTSGAETPPHTIHIRDRAFLQKAILAEVPVMEVVRITANDLKVFRRWLGRRYSRTPLPSEFNRRCSAAAYRLRTKLKKKAWMVRRICVQLTSYEELAPNEAYGLSVFLIVTASTVPGTLLYEEALSAQTLVEAAFASCAGIELHNVLIVSERELTVEEADLLTPWEYPDSISFQEGTPDQLLAEL